MWISVNKSLPAIGEYVLVSLEGETILQGQLMDNGWAVFFMDGLRAAGTRQVTNWMPMPAGPNESKTNVKPDLSRAQISAMAMQGLLANPHIDVINLENIARTAVLHADDLLRELSKP